MVSSKKSDRDDGGGTPGVVTRSQSRQQHMPANEAGTPSPPPVAVGGDPPVPAEAGTTDPPHGGGIWFLIWCRQVPWQGTPGTNPTFGG